MNDFSVDMNEYLPLRDVVFNTLRKAILKGELKPGERLMEIALADRLGVSRTPVREAMRKLELEGLVVMIPRRGAQVANITEKDLNDVLEVRIALENLSIEKACARMTEEQLAQLWDAAEEFEKTMAEGNLVKLAEADVSFHEVIYQSSDNRRLNQVLNNLREQIYRYRVEYLKDEETRNLLVKEHKELYEAIRARDVKKAQEISFRHIENQREAIVCSIREEILKSGKRHPIVNKTEKCGYSKRGTNGISLFIYHDLESWKRKCPLFCRRCSRSCIWEKQKFLPG